MDNTPCLQCNGHVDRSHKNANNKKFCSTKCRDTYPKNYAKRKELWTRNNRKAYNKKAPGKLECKICGGWYHRPITHARQRHGVSAQEYKEEFGFGRIKGVISEVSREKSREAVYEHYDVVVEENLFKGGVKTRFKKGDKTLGKYERREETLEKLKKHIKNIRQRS